MSSKKNALKNFRLYLILDKAACGTRNTQEVLKKALAGGIDIVQFRDKLSSSEMMTREARPLFQLAKKFRVPFIINDRLDVALAIDADGLHIGQDDMPPTIARIVLGKNKILGLSCHSLADVQRAQKEKVDYLGFGPVFATPTKPGVAPKGCALLKKALRCNALPLFAIGGINEERLPEVFSAGKTGVAVCRELCQDKNISKKARTLKSRLG